MNKSRVKTGNKKAAFAGKKNKAIYLTAGIALLAIAAALVIKATAGSGAKSAAASAQNGGNIQITKSQITEKATFIPYKVGDTAMEIVAVRAPDGTVRTALNTCQVCFDSGRGYYVQQGDTMVCQNCGNVFKISQIEKEKNGCNPVPISEEDKTDDGQTITIPESYLRQNAVLFAKWKR